MTFCFLLLLFYWHNPLLGHGDLGHKAQGLQLTFLLLQLFFVVLMKPSILSWLACLAIFAFLTPSLFPSSSSSSIVVFALADEEEFQSFDPFQEEEDEEEEQQQEVEEQTIFDQEEDDDFFAEVGETGTIKRQAAAARTEVPPGQVSISFQNNLEEDLILYWLNENDGSEFVMGEIAAGQGMGVNSFLGHRFTARGKESLKTASPSAVRQRLPFPSLLSYPSASSSSIPSRKTNKFIPSTPHLKPSPKPPPPAARPPPPRRPRLLLIPPQSHSLNFLTVARLLRQRNFVLWYRNRLIFSSKMVKEVFIRGVLRQGRNIQ